MPIRAPEPDVTVRGSAKVRAAAPAAHHGVADAPLGLGGAPAAFFEVDAVDIVGARAEQQDAFGVCLIEPDALVLALADGMGGHAHGARASSLAVETFIGTAKGLIEADHAPALAFDRALRAANAALAEERERRAIDETMGTTLVAALLAEGHLSWTSVGDSILWLWRDDKLRRLNDDHSLRAVERLKGTNKGNLLTSALTGEPLSEIDAGAAPIRVKAGDIVMLASDGVLSLDEGRLESLLRIGASGAIRELANSIISAVIAERNEKQDNTTLIVVRICTVPAATKPGAEEPPHALAPVLAGLALTTASALLTATVTCLVWRAFFT